MTYSTESQISLSDLRELLLKQELREEAHGVSANPYATWHGVYASIEDAFANMPVSDLRAGMVAHYFEYEYGPGYVPTSNGVERAKHLTLHLKRRPVFHAEWEEFKKTAA